MEQPTTQLPSGKSGTDNETDLISQISLVHDTDTTGPSSTSYNTGDSVGSAAIGQTSTYSSHTLRHGDAVGSVIDRSSRDPTTYKMPEHTFGQGTSATDEHSGSGVPPGAAGAAASAAFSKHNDQSSESEHSSPSHRPNSKNPASNIPGAYPKESAHDTATLPPVNRPVDYEAGRAVPDSTSSASGAGLTGGTGASDSTPASTETQRSGTLGKILGAVGLGGAATGAGLAASKSGDDRSQAVVDTPSQPTTVTGTDSYTAPTQSGPPPSHHRKESIPTTAYPAGPGSPSPIHSPVGGTRGAPDETSRTANVPSGTGATSYTIGGPSEGQESSHTGRNAGLAAAGVGAGAAALGAHEYGKDRGDTTGTSASSALPGTAQTTSSSTFPSSGGGVGSSSIPSTTQGTSGYSGGQTTGTTGYSTDPISQTSSTQPEHQSSGYGKTAAAAGLGAGAGALGAHEYGKDRGDGIGGTTSSALPGTAQTTSSSTYPSSGQGLGSSSIPSNTQGASTIGSTQGTGAGYSTGPTSQTPNTQSEQQSSGYGKTAAAAGLGAGAGALGAHEYGKHRGDNTEPTPSSAFSGNQSSVPAASTTSSSFPQTTGTGAQHDTTRGQPLTSSGPTSQLSSTERDNQSSGFGKTAAATGLGAGAGAAGASALQHDRQPDSTQQFADKPWQADQGQTQSSTATGTHLPTREKATHQPTATSTRDNATTDPSKDESHTGRNTALAGAAGAGAAGAYGAHEHSKHQAEQEAERRQKDLAEQEAARQKQYEKDQKAAEKLAHKEEKQHEKDLKKLEKQEKSHEKEIKKEEKAHQKAVAKEEKEQQKELDQEAEDRKRREKEAAAVGAAGTAGAGGAAYAAHRQHDDNDKAKLSSGSDEHERNKLHKDPPEQKKPSLFRRIFKRRKNKDTGDSEEYSTDEEDNTTHGTTTATTATGTAAGAGAGAGLAGSSADKHQTYDSKPSYNPLSKDDPLSSTTATSGTTGTHSSGVHDPTSTTHGTTSTTGTAGTGTGTGTGTGNDLPIDDVTGLPYDPAKDPAAAARLQAHDTLGHKILEKAEAKEAQQEGSGPAPLS